jgi:hypothetical protein
VHKPYNDIFTQNLLVDSSNLEFTGNSAINIRQVGRGIDIKGLENVVLLLPATIIWNDLGFNSSEFL